MNWNEIMERAERMSADWLDRTITIDPMFDKFIPTPKEKTK